MKKRAQVTVFILVAILIVAVIAIYFAVRSNLKLWNANSEFESVTYNLIKQCMIQTAEEGVYVVSENGGHYVLEMSDSNLNGEINPDYVEMEISKYIEENLEYCLIDYSKFPDVNISLSNVDANVQIKQSSVVIDVVAPIFIKKPEKGVKIKKFEDIQIPIRLGEMIYVSNELVNITNENKGLLCLSCFDSISKKHDVNIDAQKVSGNEIFFNILDLNSPDYKFKFVMNYEK